MTKMKMQHQFALLVCCVSGMQRRCAARRARGSTDAFDFAARPRWPLDTPGMALDAA